MKNNTTNYRGAVDSEIERNSSDVSAYLWHCAPRYEWFRQPEINLIHRDCMANIPRRFLNAKLKIYFLIVYFITVTMATEPEGTTSLKTKASYWTRSWASYITFPSSYPAHLWPILTLPFLLFLGLGSGRSSRNHRPQIYKHSLRRPNVSHMGSLVIFGLWLEETACKYIK